MIGCAGYFGASSRATSSGPRAARAASAERSGEATRAARGSTPAMALIASSEVVSRRSAGTGIDHAAPVPLSARALMNEPGAGGCAAAPVGVPDRMPADAVLADQLLVLPERTSITTGGACIVVQRQP